MYNNKIITLTLSVFTYIVFVVIFSFDHGGISEKQGLVNIISALALALLITAIYFIWRYFSSVLFPSQKLLDAKNTTTFLVKVLVLPSVIPVIFIVLVIATAELLKLFI